MKYTSFFNFAIFAFVISNFIIISPNEEFNKISYQERKQEGLAFQYPNKEDINETLKSTDFSLNSISLLKAVYPELDGLGINIAQKEHRSLPSDLDILGNILSSSLESSVSTLHATRVASIMVGKGITSPQSEGVAPKSSIYSVAFDNVSPEKDDFYINNKISLVNNSFGNEIEPYYGQNAIDYDAICFRNSNLLFVFSSGNQGASNSSSGNYANLKGFGNITGNYKMAKNILTVGAINQYKQISDISSRGPAYDGRIKPEVVTFSNNGTSEAAAMASGIVALAQQAYQKKYAQMPSSSLIRAILINSTEDVGIKGIDYQTGFGSLNAHQAVQDIYQKNFWENSIGNIEGKELSINVPENAVNLKITLNWTDPPSTLNAPIALVNDLDLSLSLENQKKSNWLPWVLSKAPIADSLNKIAARKRDNLNTIEQISIEKPESGLYKIKVFGYKVSNGKQSFSVAYHWDLANQISWVFPFQKNKLNANQPNVIRWKSTLKDTQGQLQYSLDKGKTWLDIAKDIDISQGFYEWNTPDVFSEAIIKLSSINQQITTSPFVISPSININSLFFCKDSAQIFWDKPNNTLGRITYNLYQLNKNKNTWEKRRTIEDTSITILGTQSDDSYAIEPILNSDIFGFRSDLINSSHSGVYCFYNNFNTIIDGKKTNLSINLTTSLGIKNLVFQKITPNGEKEIGRVEAQNNTLEYFAFDNNPQEGVNIYQVKLIFANGKEVFTQTIKIFYSEKELFWVFPTPLFSNDLLKISSNATAVFTIKIFNSMGLLLLEKPVYTGINEIKVSSISAGNYYYIISSDASPNIKKGKIHIL